MSINYLPPIAATMSSTAQPAAQDSGSGQKEFAYSRQVFSAMESIGSIPPSDRQAVLNVIAENSSAHEVPRAGSFTGVQAQHIQKSNNVYAHILNRLGYLKSFDAKKDYSWQDIETAVKAYKEDMKYDPAERGIDPTVSSLSPRLQRKMLQRYAAVAVSDAGRSSESTAPAKTEVAEDREDAAVTAAVLRDARTKDGYKNPSNDLLKEFGLLPNIKDICEITGKTPLQLWKASGSQVRSWFAEKVYVISDKGEEFFRNYEDMKAGLFLGQNMDIYRELIFIYTPSSSTLQPEESKAKLVEGIKDLAGRIKTGPFEYAQETEGCAAPFWNVRGAVIVVDSTNENLEDDIKAYLKEIADDPGNGKIISIDEDGKVSIPSIGEAVIVVAKIPQGQGLEKADSLYSAVHPQFWDQLRDLTNMPTSGNAAGFNIPGGIADGESNADIYINLRLECQPHAYDTFFRSALHDYKTDFMGTRGDASLDDAAKKKISEHHNLLFSADNSQYAALNRTVQGLAPESGQPAIDLNKPLAIENGEYSIEIFWGQEKKDGRTGLSIYAVAYDKEGRGQLLSYEQGGESKYIHRSDALARIEEGLRNLRPEMDHNRYRSGYVNDGFLNNFLDYYVGTAEASRNTARGRFVDTDNSEKAAKILSAAKTPQTGLEEDVSAMIPDILPLLGGKGSMKEIFPMANLFSVKSDMKGLGIEADKRYFSQAAVKDAVLSVRGLVSDFGGKEIQRLFNEDKDNLNVEDRRKRTEIEAIGAKRLRDNAAAMYSGSDGDSAMSRARYEQEALRAYSVILGVASGSFLSSPEPQIGPMMDNMLINLSSLVALRGEGQDEIERFNKALLHVAGLSSLTVDTDLAKRFFGEQT